MHTNVAFRHYAIWKLVPVKTNRFQIFPYCARSQQINVARIQPDCNANPVIKIKWSSNLSNAICCLCYWLNDWKWKANGFAQLLPSIETTRFIYEWKEDPCFAPVKPAVVFKQAFALLLFLFLMVHTRSSYWYLFWATSREAKMGCPTWIHSKIVNPS